MLESARQTIAGFAALVLPVFALIEVNYPRLGPQSQLAIFTLLGLVLCFLRQREKGSPWLTAADLVLALATVVVTGYVVIHSEPVFGRWWYDGASLGNRAGLENEIDIAVGVVGLLLVLEATRRAIGWVLPLLALAFLLYGRFGAILPDWLLPHRGYDVGRLVSQSFLHSQGVFGIALRVMFTYVFLFVIFGALLEMTGATSYIVESARRLFAGATGGPAKVAVLSSGMMGSLSGSAVANTATTGTFTIPMMRSAGFKPHIAAGIEAAASSGGALVPPVMGAGAYMMLEIVTPPVTYLEIVRAALIPAVLYYLSLFLIVHFTARRRAIGAPETVETGSDKSESWKRFEGLLFVAGLGGLIAFLLAGFSVFRAVTLASVAVVVVAFGHRRTRPDFSRLGQALERASSGSVALVAAAASVGIVLGVVTLTGIGTRLPALILPMAEESLILALLLIMGSSIILGMGLPSAVCYLLMATLVGPVLGELGVVPLAAHLFIFYFGMMSMVTPPVALAAYAASSIAGSPFLQSSTAAFRFSLVGFTLPFLFVFRPELLMLASTGERAALRPTLIAVFLGVVGVWSLAAAIAGYLRRPLGPLPRALLLGTAALVLFPAASARIAGTLLSLWNLAGLALFAVVALGVGGETEPANRA